MSNDQDYLWRKHRSAALWAWLGHMLGVLAKWLVVLSLVKLAA